MSKNRSFHVLLSILLTASLAGCGSSAKPESESKPGETETAPEESNTTEPAEISSRDQIYKIGDTITTDEYEFTLVDAGFADYISGEADDTFLLKAENGLDAGEGSKLFYFSVEYKHLKPGRMVTDYPFFTNEVASDNTARAGGCVMAYRKAELGWHLAYLTAPFTSIPYIATMFQPDDIEYQSEEGTYQARGAIFVSQDFIDNGNGHFTFKLNRYVFEFEN